MDMSSIQHCKFNQYVWSKALPWSNKCTLRQPKLELGRLGTPGQCARFGSTFARRIDKTCMKVQYYNKYTQYSPYCGNRLPHPHFIFEKLGEKLLSYMWRSLGHVLCWFNIQIRFKFRSYGSISPGKWSKCGIFYFFLELCWDQTVWFFQLFSTVLKRFCPLQSKNVFVLVLAHLEPG